MKARTRWGEMGYCLLIPPSQVKGLIDEADVTHIHDEWTKKKFDEGKYVSSDIYSTPRDPALIKEYQDYLSEKLGAARYEEYMKRRAGGGASQTVPILLRELIRPRT